LDDLSPETSNSDEIPERIGPYHLERRLGGGGMGEVYEGYDERLERPVALKRIRPGADEDVERARRRFRREAQSVARLHHPAIVQVHDWVETESGDWLVMELVEGRSLRHLLRDGCLEPRRAARLTRDLLEGLDAAHSVGVVHRDLKAENVMVSVASSGGDEPKEQAKILDFGVAKRFDPRTGESHATIDGRIVGTPAAMSPEQVLGRSVDHRSDLFSLGTLLYEMVTGASPFLDSSPAQTIQRLCNFQPVPARQRVPAVPGKLSAFIDRLLEKDPRRRPRSAAAALAELDDLLAELDGDRPTWRPPRGAEVLRRGGTTLLSHLLAPTPKARRWRLAAVAGGVVLVAVVAAVAFRLRPAADALYVAVPPTGVVAAPEAAGGLELAAGAAHTALLQGLLGFRGLVALEPSAADGDAGEPEALARALAADEVLTSRLECGVSHCRVVLRRLRGADGQLIFTRGFSVDPERLLELSRAVIEHLRAAYPEAELRPGIPDLQVRAEDYESYLRLRRRFGDRQEGLSTDRLLAELAELERTSPRFLALPLFQALVLGRRFQESRDPADLERAEVALARARALAPEDPRVLAREAHLARIGGRLEESAAALETLGRLEPGDVQGRVQRALLLERQGRPEEALELMREAVRRRPSAANHFDLADMLYHRGDVAGARRHLEAGLERAPDHYNGRSRLAQLELLSGSPARAAELYEQLVGRSGETAELSNLGTAHLLLGDPERAAGRFREAFELAPTSPQVALNLADAELLRGRGEEAEELYRRVLELIDRDPNPEGLLTVRAQALAHLGRVPEAVAAVQEALRRNPESPAASYEAALVYTLVGDEASALWNARRALEQGVEPRWFTFPWFDPLRPRLEEPGESAGG
jgi:serine/threonine-protein kinase